MNILNDINEKPSFEQFQDSVKRPKGKLGKVLLLVKVLSFIWETSKTIFLIYLAYKTFLS